jgi:hypothetical protein
MTPTKEIRRTRRVKNPFDASIEVRMYSTEKEKLFAEAKARNLSTSDLVRSQLGDLIATDPPPIAVPAAVPDISLIDAICEALDCHSGQALLKIKLGKVTLSGNPWTHSTVPADRLKDVAVDGSPLVE